MCKQLNEGYIVPLHICQGLPDLDMLVLSCNDLDSLPHVFFCADTPWDPAVLDNEFNPADFDAPDEAKVRRQEADSRVDATGRLVSLVDQIVHAYTFLVQSVFMVTAAILSMSPQIVLPNLPDLDHLKPNFAWIPIERIKKTLEATTQYYRATVHHPFCKHFNSRFPAANIRGIPE